MSPPNCCTDDQVRVPFKYSHYSIYLQPSCPHTLHSFIHPFNAFTRCVLPSSYSTLPQIFLHSVLLSASSECSISLSVSLLIPLNLLSLYLHCISLLMTAVMVGSHYDNIFIHYKPTSGWDYSWI